MDASTGKPGRAGADQRVTIADVARLAQVSPATVSRYFNGRRLRPELNAAVARAVAELGYSPNLIARGLRRQVSDVWACIVSDIENQFFTALVRGVDDAARAVRHSVVLCNTDEDPEREAECLRLVEALRVAGVVISASNTSTDIGSLVRAGVPVVSVDRRMSQPTDTVLVNSYDGAQAATAHLIAKGCRRIACVTGPPTTTTGEERLRGYQAALRDAGFEPSPELARHADFKEAGGFAAARELLASPQRPDGFFVANNEMTMGVLRALAAAGVAVPTEAAVAGFDDLPWWPMSRPSITAVAQPAYEMGGAAAQMLAERTGGYAGPPRLRYFEPRLVERQSSRLGTPLGDLVASWPLQRDTDHQQRT